MMRTVTVKWLQERAVKKMKVQVRRRYNSHKRGLRKAVKKVITEMTVPANLKLPNK
jgi:hypothetical protein